jgi:hypothetical protein
MLPLHPSLRRGSYGPVVKHRTGVGDGRPAPRARGRARRRGVRHGHSIIFPWKTERKKEVTSPAPHRTAPLQFLLMVGTGARKSRGDFSSVPDEGAWGSPARVRNDDFGVPCCVPGRAARLFCSSIVCRDLDWPKTTTGEKKGPSSSSCRDEIGASRALPSKCLSCSCRISHVLTGTVEGGRLQALAHRTTVFYRSP